MSTAEIVSYLRDWKTAGDFRRASPEGLGRELTALVAEEPEKYAAGCSEFMRLSEPTYLRSIVQGFHDAVKSKRGFAWRPVLDLCVWAVGKIEKSRDVFSGLRWRAPWGWTTAAISRLLTEGFSSEENPIPFELREQVWSGIVVGTLDPEPTPEQEKGNTSRKRQRESSRVKGLTSATAFDPYELHEYSAWCSDGGSREVCALGEKWI